METEKGRGETWDLWAEFFLENIKKSLYFFPIG